MGVFLDWYVDIIMKNVGILRQKQFYRQKKDKNFVMWQLITYLQWNMGTKLEV